MKLIELAYFTENIQEMADFYRGLLGAEPVAKSDNMAIFINGHGDTVRCRVFMG